MQIKVFKKHVLTVRPEGAGTEKEDERQRKGDMEPITCKFCQQIRTSSDSPQDHIKRQEEHSSQHVKESENNNIPSLQDIKNLVKEELDKRIAEFKDEINTPKKREQLDQSAIKDSETNNEIGDKTEENECFTFSCEFCDFKAGKKGKLNEHINSKHPDKERPFTCNYCDHKLKSRKEIKKHLQMEKGNTPVKNVVNYQYGKSI